MVLTVSCSHTGLCHSKSRDAAALLPSFSRAVRATRSTSLTTEDHLPFGTPGLLLLNSTHEAVLVKEMLADAEQVKVHFPLVNRPDGLL